MAHHCQTTHGHGTATQGCTWGYCEVQCVPDVREMGLFAHVRDNLRGDVSGKRFSTHTIERNVAGVA